MSKLVAIWSLRKYRGAESGAIYDPMESAEENAMRAEITRIIGLRIRQAREQRGWSQEKLGVLVGYHRNSVNRWEQGLAAIDATSLYLVCCALDLSPVNILKLITIADDRASLPMSAAGHA